MFKNPRLLPPDLLPDSLWNSLDEIISMPPILHKAYLNLITKHNLQTLALSRGYQDSPVGGITQEDTDLHLAQAFDGSSARVQLALMDPKNDTNGASDAFIKSLSGNKLIIIDAPCGSGAATLTFLSAIADLREKKVLPRVPLDIILIGAEIAVSARTYAQELTEDILNDLEEQAIFVKYQFHNWDATSNLSTTDLIKNIITSGLGYPKCLVVIANFSGFLHTKMRVAQPQIQELLRYSSGESNLAIWIEPRTNKVMESGSGLFAKIAVWTTSKLSKYIQFDIPYPEDRPYAISDAKFRRPIKSDDVPRVNLAVISLNLKRPYEE